MGLGILSFLAYPRQLNHLSIIVRRLTRRFICLIFIRDILSNFSAICSSMSTVAIFYPFCLALLFFVKRAFLHLTEVQRGFFYFFFDTQATIDVADHSSAGRQERNITLSIAPAAVMTVSCYKFESKESIGELQLRQLESYF